MELVCWLVGWLVGRLVKLSQSINVLHLRLTWR